MDVRYLKTFVAVAEHGTFAAAADAVGLSPSSVSMQIRALEQHLEIELFDRSHRPPVFTDRGLKLLPTAREIIRLHDSLRDAAAPADEFIGQLRVGVIPTALSSFMPVVLSGLNEAHPLIEVHIVTGMSTPLLKLMKNEQLDAGIIGEPPRLPTGLIWRPFISEAICVIAPPDAEGVAATDLLQRYSYIELLRGPSQLHMVEERVAKMGVSLRTIMQLDSIEAVTLMVHHGLGVSIVPRRTVELLLRLPIKMVEFGDPPLFRTLGLVHTQGSPKTPLANALFDQLTRVCSKKWSEQANGNQASGQSCFSAPLR
jgi:DNA-binding transcriptional LysR family regulator